MAKTLAEWKRKIDAEGPEMAIEYEHSGPPGKRPRLRLQYTQKEEDQLGTDEKGLCKSHRASRLRTDFQSEGVSWKAALFYARKGSAHDKEYSVAQSLHRRQNVQELALPLDVHFDDIHIAMPVHVHQILYREEWGRFVLISGLADACFQERCS